MVLGRQAAMAALKSAQEFHRKYYDTTNYIAIVVTIMLILQIWWMTRGHG